MLWLILGGFAVFAVAILLFGILRSPGVRTARVEHDLEVYRAQLDELERERGVNLISDIEAEAAKIEIQRRILAADVGDQVNGTAARRLPVLAVLLTQIMKFWLNAALRASCLNDN